MFIAVAIGLHYHYIEISLTYSTFNLIAINDPEIQRFCLSCLQLNHFKRRGRSFLLSFSNWVKFDSSPVSPCMASPCQTFYNFDETYTVRLHCLFPHRWRFPVHFCKFREGLFGSLLLFWIEWPLGSKSAILFPTKLLWIVEICRLEWLRCIWTPKVWLAIGLLTDPWKSWNLQYQKMDFSVIEIKPVGVKRQTIISCYCNYRTFINWTRQSSERESPYNINPVISSDQNLPITKLQVFLRGPLAERNHLKRHKPVLAQG